MKSVSLYSRCPGATYYVVCGIVGTAVTARSMACSIIISGLGYPILAVMLYIGPRHVEDVKPKKKKTWRSINFRESFCGGDGIDGGQISSPACAVWVWPRLERHP